jgi:hypothetical protein
MDMYQQCFKQMTKALANWSTAEVKIVPGVMYQVRCGIDENDPNIEYQMNWFIDCTETFVHNHRHSFHTLCLEGGYKEKLWEISDDGTGAVTYQFYRKSGNIFDAPKMIPGVLRPAKFRSHFPGNILHVGIEQYHSITPSSSDNRVFTFLAKRKHSPTPDMYVLSSSPTIDAPSDEIRDATEEERQSMYQQVLHIWEITFLQ